MIENCIKLVKNTLRIQAYLSSDLEAAILEVAMPFVTYSLHYSESDKKKIDTYENRTHAEAGKTHKTQDSSPVQNF